MTGGGESSGMGAEVAVNKIDSDDNVVQSEGAASSASKTAYVILGILLTLSTFGVWKIIELLAIL